MHVFFHFVYVFFVFIKGITFNCYMVKFMEFLVSKLSGKIIWGTLLLDVIKNTAQEDFTVRTNKASSSSRIISICAIWLPKFRPRCFVKVAELYFNTESGYKPMFQVFLGFNACFGFIWWLAVKLYFWRNCSCLETPLAIINCSQTKFVSIMLVLRSSLWFFKLNSFATFVLRMG